MTKSKSFTWEIFNLSIKFLLSSLSGCVLALFMAIANFSYGVQVLGFFTGTLITFVRIELEEELIELKKSNK